MPKPFMRDRLIKTYLLLQLFRKQSDVALPLAVQGLLNVVLCPTDPTLKAQFRLSAEFAFLDVTVSNTHFPF